MVDNEKIAVMSTIRRLFKYTTPRAAYLYLLGVMVGVATLMVFVVLGSMIVLSWGLSGAVLLWWPLIRDLVPVAWSVLIKGRWPPASSN